MNFRTFTCSCLVALGFVVCVAQLTAQPACNYSIDVDGDSVADGILYRDILWSSSDITQRYHDRAGGLGAILYSEDAVLYNGSKVDLKMDVYLPPMIDSLSSVNLPVIYFFYGGGYTQGTSKRVEDLCLQMARRGYVTVAPNYRLGIKGMMPGDTTHVCENLLEPAFTIYRGMLDAQASMRWMMDSAETVLGIDIDTTNMFLWGPGYFPLLSHMQADEVPVVLQPLGILQDIDLKATIGRSAAMNLMTYFIDEDDKTPFLIFHGTCDKSVPFRKTNMYKRLECDTVLPVSATINYPIYGSLDIVKAVDHYFEYYPICGLHHSHKDVEVEEMREPIAAFLYNMICDNIAPATPPVYFPWIVQPCDVSGKCETEDNYWFCDGATMLGGSCPGDSLAVGSESRVSLRNGVSVFPNPSMGQFTLTYNAVAEKTVVVKIYDQLGREHYQVLLEVVPGLNMKAIAVPESNPGIYYLSVDGKSGPSVVIE